MKPLFARLSGETTRIYGLILDSAGIPCKLRPQGRFWAVYVPIDHRRAAIKAVSLYLSENPVGIAPKLPTADTGLRTYSAFYITPFLALIHWAITPGYEHQVFVDTFGSDAWQIMGGELYRCCTALLLHKDWPHVINNMAGLALFGTVAASICGWGMGWLLTLLSGAVGNLATAMWYGDEHVAIGASTAVFGALGICIALNVWRHLRATQPSWRSWLPLAGGLALLGLLGGSPHSDLMAHFTGFLAGAVIGGAYGTICRQSPGLAVQIVAAAVGGALIGVSWVTGVFAGG